MKFKKNEIIEKVNDRDCDYFYEIYNESYQSNDEIEIVYEVNYGDGNEYKVCLHFIKHKFYVLLDGTYSSWDDPYWDSVSFAMPFEFTETRYKTATLDYIRDKKINDLLGDDE